MKSENYSCDGLIATVSNKRAFRLRARTHARASRSPTSAAHTRARARASRNIIIPSPNSFTLPILYSYYCRKKKKSRPQREEDTGIPDERSIAGSSSTTYYDYCHTYLRALVFFFFIFGCYPHILSRCSPFPPRKPNMLFITPPRDPSPSKWRICLQRFFFFFNLRDSCFFHLARIIT